MEEVHTSPAELCKNPAFVATTARPFRISPVPILSVVLGCRSVTTSPGSLHSFMAQGRGRKKTIRDDRSITRRMALHGRKAAPLCSRAGAGCPCQDTPANVESIQDHNCTFNCCATTSWTGVCTPELSLVHTLAAG